MTRKEKQDLIVKKTRLIAFAVYRGTKTKAGKFIAAYDKVFSRVYIDFDVKLSEIVEGSKNMFDVLDDEHLDMMVHSIDNLFKMYELSA